MITKHPYIYLCIPQSSVPYYLVRFRNNKGQYVQATFGNVNKPAEALKRAISWRDKYLPRNRKIHSRNLLIKPLRNKSTNLPAGITFSYLTKKTKSGINRYNYFMITAGWDKNGKVILKIVYVTNGRNYDQALRIAKKVRKQLAAENGKIFTNKKPR